MKRSEKFCVPKNIQNFYCVSTENNIFIFVCLFIFYFFWGGDWPKNPRMLFVLDRKSLFRFKFFKTPKLKYVMFNTRMLRDLKYLSNFNSYSLIFWKILFIGIIIG